MMLEVKMLDSSMNLRQNLRIQPALSLRVQEEDFEESQLFINLTNFDTDEQCRAQEIAQLVTKPFLLRDKSS